MPGPEGVQQGLGVRDLAYILRAPGDGDLRPLIKLCDLSAGLLATLGKRGHGKCAVPPHSV
jgi:hypothetical protein